MKKLLFLITLHFNLFANFDFKEYKNSILVIKNQSLAMQENIKNIRFQIDQLSDEESILLAHSIKSSQYYNFLQKEYNLGVNVLMEIDSMLEEYYQVLSLYPSNLNSLLKLCYKDLSYHKVLKNKIGLIFSEILFIIEFIKKSGISQDILDKAGFEY